MIGQVHTARRHDSALKHVTGQALYIDDIAEPPGTLHGALVLSAGFLAFGIAFAVNRTQARARRVFLASLAYLPALLTLLALAR